MVPRILVFAGSTRSGSFSGRTADAAQKELALHGADVTRISLSDYPLPIIDEDLEKEKGIPENVIKLARHFYAHHGMLICTPEYNSSIPPLLKNTLDWLSRVRRDGGRPLRPYEHKVVAICSSSDGGFAGRDAIAHLRQVLMKCQVEIVTPQCCVPHADQAFDEDGQFKEERLRHQMTRVASTLLERVRMQVRLEG